MPVLGVTGSFGTGKTFVASVFGSLGAAVIDADRYSRIALRKGAPAYRKIVACFGDKILAAGGDIDRKILAGIVFGDKAKLKALNDIAHPEVIKKIKKKVGFFAKDEVVVIDAPLLIEAGLAKDVDILIAVKASRKNQIERCAAKFGCSRKDVLMRVKNQIPLKRKIAMADFVIDNDGTRSGTRKQVMEIWRIISRTITKSQTDDF